MFTYIDPLHSFWHHFSHCRSLLVSCSNTQLIPRLTRQKHVCIPLRISRYQNMAFESQTRTTSKEREKMLNAAIIDDNPGRARRIVTYTKARHLYQEERRKTSPPQNDPEPTYIVRSAEQHEHQIKHHSVTRSIWARERQVTWHRSNTEYDVF